MSASTTSSPAFRVPAVSHALARTYRLRRMLDLERRRAACGVRLLRLQRLLLAAQRKLDMAIRRDLSGGGRSTAARLPV